MKDSREEYDDKYSPEPFNELQETTDGDITGFSSLVIIDIDECFAKMHESE